MWGGRKRFFRLSAIAGQILTVFCLISYPLTSCSEISADYPGDEDVVGGITVSEAKSVFERTVAESFSQTGTPPTGLFLPTLALENIVPNWRTAKRSLTTSEDLLGMQVEISSINKYRVYQVDKENRDTCVVKVLDKLLIVKDASSGAVGCFVEFDVRSNKYVKNFGIGGYSGLKIYTDLAGNIIRINKYEEGVAGCRVNVTSANDLKDFIGRMLLAQYMLSDILFQNGMPATKGGDYGPGYESSGDYVYLRIGGTLYKISREMYEEVFLRADFDGGVLEAAICTESSDKPSVEKDPEPIPEDPEEVRQWLIHIGIVGDGKGTNDDDEQHSGGYVPNESFPTFTCSGGTDKQQNAVKKAIEEAKSHKLTRNLFKSLKTKNVLIQIEQDVVCQGRSVPASYNNKDNIIRINQAMMFYNKGNDELAFYKIALYEEIFHMYQYENNPNWWSEYKGDVEFEAKVFISILVMENKLYDTAFSFQSEDASPFYKYYQNPTNIEYYGEAMMKMVRLGYPDPQFKYASQPCNETGWKRYTDYIFQHLNTL